MTEPDKQEGVGDAAGWRPVDEAGAPGPGQAPWPPAPDGLAPPAPGVDMAGMDVPGGGEPLPAALAPPPPPAIPQATEAAPARSSSLRPLLLICALSVVSASICAGVILYVRGGDSSGASADAQGENKPTALPGEPMPPVITTGDPGAAGSPGAAATPGKVVRAVVNLPQGQPRAVLRNKPAFEGDVVVFLPPGTAVEITNSTTATGGTWFRVKTVDFQPPASGWVHGAILKMQ